jgi:ketosteroid isomerase-like protein
VNREIKLPIRELNRSNTEGGRQRGSRHRHVSPARILGSCVAIAFESCEVQHGDVQRFDEILAEDFLCSNPDGSLVDKKQFLAQTARPVTISGLSVEDVRVRVLGDVAIIHARTSYTTSGGDQRNGRYTDVWARRDGRCLAVSAHVTR